MTANRSCFKNTPEFTALINCNATLVANLPTFHLFQRLYAIGMINKELLYGLTYDRINKIKNQQFLLTLQSKTLDDFHQFWSILSHEDFPRKDLAKYVGDELKRQNCQEYEVTAVAISNEVCDEKTEVDDSQRLTDQEEVDEGSDGGYYDVAETNEMKSIVYVWGANNYGQLGGVDTENNVILTPIISRSMSNLDPIMMVAGLASTFIVTKDGRVFVCGYGKDGHLGLGVTNKVVIPKQLNIKVFVTKLASFHLGQHVLALTKDGKVLSWGSNAYGQLGNGDCKTIISPTIIEAISSKDFIDIACGSDSSAAITTNGALYTWGCGFQGCLGHGDTEICKIPKKVQELCDFTVTAVACGCWHMLAITDSNRVWSWGHGYYGQLGHGHSKNCLKPTVIKKLPHKTWLKIVCGWDVSMVLSNDGIVWSWGYNADFLVENTSQLIIDEPRLLHTLVNKRKKVIDLGASNCHCVALTDCGEIYLWGASDNGRLGNGSDVKDNKCPQQCAKLRDVNITSLGCIAAHCTAWKLIESTDGNTLIV